MKHACMSTGSSSKRPSKKTRRVSRARSCRRSAPRRQPDQFRDPPHTKQPIPEAWCAVTRATDLLTVAVLPTDQADYEAGVRRHTERLLRRALADIDQHKTRTDQPLADAHPHGKSRADQSLA